MPRPCGHSRTEPDPNCGTCTLIERNPKVAAVYDGGNEVKRLKSLLVLSGCPHRSAEAIGSVKCPSCSGNVTLKVYACKVHGSCTLAKRSAGHHVCKGCTDNPNTPVVSAPVVSSREDNRYAGRMVLIPDLVPQLPTVTSPLRRAIATYAVGEEGRALLAASRPSLEHYARRVHADLVVLTEAPVPDWPMSVKCTAHNLLAPGLWREIAMIDADVVIPPGAPDVFAMRDAHEVGACDELAWHKAQPVHGLESGYKRFRSRMSLPALDSLPFYVNAGITVVPARSRYVIQPPAELWIEDEGVNRHCAEQHWINAGLHNLSVPYRLLDRRCNWQNWTDYGFRDAPPDAIRHWSGAQKDRVSRAEQMSAYWEMVRPEASREKELVLPEINLLDSSWEIDDRHLRWIRATITPGRFDRVLEVGCHRGSSTRVLLDALQSKDVGRLHLCDTAATPELYRVIDHYGTDPLTRMYVHVHQRPSTEILAPDPPYDLVVLDGDHSAHTVLQEAELIIRSGVRAVFAHDTAASREYPNCDGPVLLKGLLQAAGYYCLEDSVSRPGELTHRGLLFASLSREDYEAARSAYTEHC